MSQGIIASIHLNDVTVTDIYPMTSEVSEFYAADDALSFHSQLGDRVFKHFEDIHPAAKCF